LNTQVHVHQSLKIYKIQEFITPFPGQICPFFGCLQTLHLYCLCGSSFNMDGWTCTSISVTNELFSCTIGLDSTGSFARL